MAENINFDSTPATASDRKAAADFTPQAGNLQFEGAPRGYEDTEPLAQVSAAQPALKYAPYTQYFGSLNTRDAAAARGQSAGSKLAGGLYQGVVGEVIGGTLQGLGSFGMFADSEENFLYQLGEGLREHTMDATPIFEREAGKAFAFNDVGWWAKNMPSMLSTLSMFIPGAAIGKGAAMLGRAAAASGRAGRILKGVQAAQKADKTVDKAEAAAALAGKEAALAGRMESQAQTIGTALGMRHAENIREAMDIQQQATTDFIESGMSVEEMKGTEAYRAWKAENGDREPTRYDLAKYVGGAAAKRSYAVNSSNLVFDLAQSAMIFKPFKLRTRGAKATTAEAADAAKKLGDKVVKEAKGNRFSRFADRYGEYIGGMASEGVEEAVNFIGSGEGIAYGEQLRGMENEGFQSRLNDYLNDDHLWESAFFGALGGGLFQAVGGAFGKKQNALLKSYEERIKTQKYFAEKIKKAEEKGDVKEVKKLKNQMITNLAMQAAQQGRVDQLIDQLNDEAYIEELAKTGIGTKEELMEQREQIIETVLTAEKHYRTANQWAIDNGMDAFARGEYLKDSIDQQNLLDYVNKRIEEIEEEGNVQQDERSVMAAKKAVLEDLKKRMQGNKLEQEKFKDQFIALQEEVTKYEEKQGKPIDISAANEATYESQALAVLQQSAKDRLAYMKSDAAIVRYNKLGQETAKKQQKKLEKDLLKNISEMENEEQLEDFIKKSRRNKDTKFKEAAERRLKELREQKKVDKKVKTGKSEDSADTTGEEGSSEDDGTTTETGQTTLEFPEDDDQSGATDEEDAPPSGPTRKPLELEPLPALLQRIQQEGEEARDALLAELKQVRVDLTNEKKRIRRAIDAAKKAGKPTATLEANYKQADEEQGKLTKDYIPALRKMEFKEDKTTVTSDGFKAREEGLDESEAKRRERELLEDGGANVFALDLIRAFLPHLTAGKSLFGLPFDEWRLDSSSANVKDGRLVIADEDVEKYKALQAALQGKAKVRIVETDESFGTESSEEASIFSRKEASRVDKIPRKRIDGKVQYKVKRGKERHYAIEVDLGTKKVIIGYVPQATTALKHAASSLSLLKKEEREAALDLLASDITGDRFAMQTMFAMMHTGDFQALEAVDRIITLRRILDRRDGVPLDIDLRQEGRGSLLRPSVDSTVRLGDLHNINTTIEEHGICIMVSEGQDTYLYNLKTGQREARKPYQDGKKGLDSSEGIDYGKGSFFVPIQASDDVNDIIYVRIGDVPLSRIGNGVIEDVLDTLKDQRLSVEERTDALRAVMAVRPNSKELTETQLANITNNHLKNGAIVTPTRTYFVQGGVAIGVYNNKTGEFIATESEAAGVSTVSDAIGQMNFRGTVRDGAQDYSLENDRIAQLVQEVQSPVAPIIDAHGNFIGYRHPITALEQRNPKLYNPDTRQTQATIQVDMSQLVDESTDVVEPEDKKPKGKKKEESSGGVKKTSGKNPFFMTTEVAAESQLDRQATDKEQKQAEEWLDKNLPHVPFRRVRGLITRGGATAYGIWEQGTVQVSDLAVVGTEFHEAFHAVMDTYLPESRKAKILAEADKKYGNPTSKQLAKLKELYPDATASELQDIYLEERLAEAFREYMLSSGLSMAEKSATARFFAELLELIQAMFTGQFRARQLMQQINKGTFAYKPDARTKNYVKKYMAVPGFSALELKELASVLPLALNETLDQVNQYLAAKQEGQEKANEFLDEYYSDPQAAKLKEKVRQIGDAVAARRTEQPETDGESKPLGKKEIAELVLEAAFEEQGGIETLFFWASVNASDKMKEQMDADIDRIRLNKDALVRDMLNRKGVVSALVDTLEADVITGNTDAQQYGGKSMMEVNPKEKIPASVRNLISRTMAMPTVLSEAVIEAMEQNDPEVLRDAVLKHAAQNTFDQFSQFGLPRMLDFNQVYPYLLHHLSTATNYAEMLQRLEDLGRKGNPDMLLLKAKLEDSRTPELVRNQFFVAFKRAKTDEISVTTRNILIGGRSESVTVTDHNKPFPAEAGLAFHNRQTIQSKLDGMSSSQIDAAIKALRDWGTKYVDKPLTVKERKQLRELLRAVGYTTQTPNALNVALMRLPNNALAQIAQQVATSVDLLQSKVDSNDKRAFNILKTVAANVVPADYQSVTVGYRNGAGTTVYSHMLPCYLTEEVDRLRDKTYRTKVMSQDSRLQPGLAWEVMLRDGQQAEFPVYMRFGHYKGKPYTKLTVAQRALYDIATMYPDGGRKNSDSSYIAIPVPSDADNTMLVRSMWLSLSASKRRKELQHIIDVDQNTSDSRLPQTVEELEQKFKQEGIEYLAKIGKSGRNAIKKIAAERSKKENRTVTSEEIAAEMMAAQFHSNWNTAHWIGGAVEEFDNGSTIQMQKRFKQVLSPGTPSFLNEDSDMFVSITFEEPIKEYADDDPRSKEFGAVKRADAQTYVTLAHYRRVMRAHGKLTPAMDAAITKAENREKLTRGERALLRPYKPFYYGRIERGGVRVGVQIKNSLFPLIPLDTEGTELDKLRDFMETNNIDQAQPVTAHKVGRPSNTVKLWTKDNKWDSESAQDFSASVQTLPMAHYRQQVQINDHMMNSDTIGWGTQVSKIIMGGLLSMDSLTIGGKTMTGQEVVDQLKHKENELVRNQIKEIRKRYFTKEGELDEVAIRKLLQSELGDQAASGLRQLLDDVEHGRASITNPHYKGQIALALISLMQKKHKHLQVPGGTQVQVSDLGRDNGVSGDLEGMRIDPKTGKVLPAQVITSRNFLPKKYRNMSIEEIRKVDPEALQMVVYRIPGEGKNSMAVVEVVEFLENGQDGMIVPADFVAQMGSDFDVDKLYINWKSDRSGKNAEIWNEYFDLMKGVLTDPTVFEQEVRKPQGFELLQELAKKRKATARGRQLKTMDGTIDTYLRGNPYSGLSQLQLWEDNMAGVSLKGIAAKANTFWLNVERFGFEVEFETKAGGITKLDPSNVDLAHRQLTAQGVAAAMDGAKDPVYGYLGLNEKNWEFFHDLYMLGMSLEDAIKIASNPQVVAELNFEGDAYLKTDRTDAQKAEDAEAMEVFEAYKKDWQKVLMPLKMLARVGESKLIDMAQAITPVAAGGPRQAELRTVKHNGAEGDGVQDVPILSAHLELTEAIKEIMGGLQIHYFTMKDATGLEFAAHLRGQTYMSADNYLGAAVGDFKRMGKISTLIEEGATQRPQRKQREEGDYSNWNMQDFISYFATEEGQALLEADPDLARVLQHTRLGKEYKAMPAGTRDQFRLINLLPVGLSDAEVANDFSDSWDALLTDSSKHPIASALGTALVEYEAERSGWRYGSDTFSQHLPHSVVMNLTAVDNDTSGNTARLIEALNPNIPQVFRQKEAEAKRGAVKYVDKNGRTRIYLDRYNAVEEKFERGFVILPNSSQHKGFKGLVSLGAIEQALSANIAETKKKSRSVKSVGTEENYDTRKQHLEGVFASAGIRVKVRKDRSIEGAGEVVWDGETGEIKVHPSRMGGDTVIHEFAHIYVELLGYEHPLVQDAIKELRGTALYQEIKELYPNLNQRDLDLEVLVTAMGRKGDKIFNNAKQENRFQTLIRRIIRAIGKVLGVQQDTAKFLAQNMIAGVGLNAKDVKAFKAEQRISKRVNEAKLQEEIVRELGERTREMRELGMTNAEETQMMNEIIEGRRKIANVNVEASKADVVSSVTDFAEDMLERTNAFLDVGPKYLASSRNVAEMTQSDVDFFNSIRQLKQTLSTLEQAVQNFEETEPGDKVLEFKKLKDRIPQVLRNLRDLEREAVNNKLKAQSANLEIREIEENLFDLAANTELSHYMQDSGAATMWLQGMGEQGPVVLQLLKKQIDRVVEGAAMEVRNDKAEVDRILDNYGDAPIENLLDETGQAFISPIRDAYWEERAEAAAAGIDLRLWEAQNNHMPYTNEYYEWLYSKENQEIRQLTRKLNQLKEIKAKRGLTEEEIIQEEVWKKDLEDLRVSNNRWGKFNEHDVDVEGYTAARAKAKKDGTLEQFDQEHPWVLRGSKYYPAIGNPYHKGFKVRDKYKNPNWKEGDTQRPLDQWKNPAYEKLSDLEKETISGLQKVMGKYLPQDSPFMQQNLIPQIGEIKGKSLKEHVNQALKVEGKEQRQRLDAEGRFVPIRSVVPILRRNKKGDKVNTNLRESIPEFLDQVSAERTKNTLSALMLATRDQLADSDLVTGKGIDVVGSGKRTEKKEALTRGERSRAIRVLDHALEGYLGQGWTDQGKNDKRVKKFLTYTSFMGIGLNVSAWVNNVAYGSLQQRLETLGGAQWSRKQMRQARRKVQAGLLDLIKARNKNSVPTSRDAALLTFFDVTMDQRELPDGVDTINKLFDKAYFGQTYGEIVMQSQVMLALMMNTQVRLPGEEGTISLYDALEWKGGKDIVLPKGAMIVKADGLEVPLTLQELGALKSKARGILQRIHGAYNQEDIGMWHRSTLGQVVYQFRKWVPQSVKRRFGKDSFNEIREEQEVGYYRALWNGVLAGAFKDGKFGAFLAAYNEMSDKPHMQAAARKATMELGAAVFLFAMTNLLASLVELDDDDDDEFALLNDEYYKAKLLYHTDRLYMEFAQYTPIGIVDFAKKFGKDPAAAWRTMMTAGNVAAEATYTAFSFGELRTFQGGRHYGDIKLTNYIERLVPGWKQYIRMRDTVDSYQTYRLV